MSHESISHHTTPHHITIPAVLQCTTLEATEQAQNRLSIMPKYAHLDRYDKGDDSDEKSCVMIMILCDDHDSKNNSIDDNNDENDFTNSTGYNDDE
jgi:hypothetical protein